MGQSLSQLYVHLSFSTKHRKPAILPELKEKLHSYMAGTLKKYESPALIINSVPDHIHILFRLSKNHALSKIVEEIKKGSSKWMKSQLNLTRNIFGIRWCVLEKGVTSQVRPVAGFQPALFIILQNWGGAPIFDVSGLQPADILFKNNLLTSMPGPLVFFLCEI